MSVELHPDLAANARHRLARLGHFPILFTGDGSAGAPGHAPYDCILATCATAAIPPAWIDQLADGGRIVTDLRTEVSSALTVLTKTAPDRVDGHLLGDPTVDRIGLTARADGHTTYWIDEPDNESASKFSIRTCAPH